LRSKLIAGGQSRHVTDVLVFQRAEAAPMNAGLHVVAAVHPVLLAESSAASRDRRQREARFDATMISGNLTCMKECEIRCASA
jgi:hypothetical protein